MTRQDKSMGEPKLTKAQRRVLGELTKRGGRASAYDLAYPRSHLMHRLFMAGLVTTDGPLDVWGAPSLDGVWVITDAGRAALEHPQ